MKETLFDLAYNVFYDTAQTTPADVDFNLSSQVKYPKIEFIPSNHVIIPQPTEFNGMYFFEGHVFDSYDEHQDTIWSLFLASIYHTAAHVKVSDFTKYEYWMQDKTPEKGWKVIDFIEDIKVENYLKNLYPEAWENISEINKICNRLTKITIPRYSKKRAKKIFSNYYFINRIKEISELKKLLQKDNVKFNETVPYLDFLYNNQQLLPENIPTYCDEHNFTEHGQPIINMKIVPKGEFVRFTERIHDLWIKEKRQTDKIIKNYETLTKNLYFDEVRINPENYGEFLRMRGDSSSLIRNLRGQVETVPNVMDAPVTEDFGQMEIQKAIQRVASQNESVQVFEQDQINRLYENWVIIFDTSASMKLHFDDMKKFTYCLCETAEILQKRGGKWGMYCFNNNFLVVKDQDQKYDQKSKARLGGIKNQGLSFIPDAIKVGCRILMADTTCEKKYLILITDGKLLGYNRIDEKMQESITLAKRAGINIIGIGVPTGVAKSFTATINERSLRKSVKKFIDAYTAISQSQL